MSDSATPSGGTASGGPPPPPPTATPTQTPSAKEVVASAAGFLRSIGARAERRATPRFAVLLGVAGALVASLGPILASTNDPPEDAVMIGLYVLLTGAGFALVWLFRNGVLAAAGATASAIALFSLFGYLLDSEVSQSQLDLTPVVILSAIGWMAMYLVGPGRGHTVYAAFTSASLGLLFVTLISEDTQNFFMPGSSTTWGFIIIGCAWAALGLVLDRQRLAGLATAFLGVGASLLAYAVVCLLYIANTVPLPTSLDGVADLRGAPELTDLLLPGFAAIAIGLAAMRYGVAARRRATSWVGCAVLAGGMWALLFGLTGTNPTVATVLMVLLGAGLVYGAHELGRRLGEPDELSEADSFADGGIVMALRTFTETGTPAAGTWGADESQGPGWWVASDGKWYPPQPGSQPTSPTPTAAPSTPDRGEQQAAKPAAASPLDDLPPAPGWWKASDGKWYPPKES